jgi:hypothetical protein
VSRSFADWTVEDVLDGLGQLRNPHMGMLPIARYLGVGLMRAMPPTPPSQEPRPCASSVTRSSGALQGGASMETDGMQIFLRLAHMSHIGQ